LIFGDRTVATVPDDIVESTWREVASLESGAAWRAMEKVTKRQPALLAYVMASTKDSRPQVQELAIYLFFVVLRMFERLPGHQVKRVDIGKVERCAGENEARLERYSVAHERFLEREAQSQAHTQPHVLRYICEAVLEEEDPSLKLTEEESGLVFLVLKTVLDLLDRACREKRR
jgi:hypothetical protein